MKKQTLILMLGVSILATSPLFADGSPNTTTTDNNKKRRTNFLTMMTQPQTQTQTFAFESHFNVLTGRMEPRMVTVNFPMRNDGERHDFSDETQVMRTTVVRQQPIRSDDLSNPPTPTQPLTSSISSHEDDDLEMQIID